MGKGVVEKIHGCVVPELCTVCMSCRDILPRGGFDWVFIGRVDGSAKCAGISIIATLFWCGCYIDQVLCNLLKDTHVSASEISRSENVGR